MSDDDEPKTRDDSPGTLVLNYLVDRIWEQGSFTGYIAVVLALETPGLPAYAQATILAIAAAKFLRKG